MSEAILPQNAFAGRSPAVKLLAAFILLTILAMTAPMMQGKASAAATETGLLAQGAIEMPLSIVTPAVEVASSVGSAIATTATGVGNSIVLGAPGSSTVALGDGFFGAFGDAYNWGATIVGDLNNGCTLLQLSKCISGVAHAIWDAGLGYIVKKILKWISDAMVAAVQALAKFILVDELGGSTTGIQDPNLGAQFFSNQYETMRNVGLYLIVPLMMLVVIQSILRGSLYFLLRAALIMVPVAVLGSVVVVTLADQLLHISDDMSKYLAQNGAGLTAFDNNMNSLTGGIDTAGTGMFFFLWAIVFVVAAIIIYIELLLRQTGIYLAALFMPLAFAAMVWPPTAKWVKRLVELIIGLIFSKVFIVAAISLGVGAIGHSDLAPAANAADPASGTSQGIAAIAAGSAMMLMGAFAGTKVLAIAPGASDEKVVNTAKTWTKLQLSLKGAAALNRRNQNKLSEQNPTGTFSNGPKGNGNGNGDSDSLTPTKPGPSGGGGDDGTDREGGGKDGGPGNRFGQLLSAGRGGGALALAGGKKGLEKAKGASDEAMNVHDSVATQAGAGVAGANGDGSRHEASKHKADADRSKSAAAAARAGGDEGTALLHDTAAMKSEASASQMTRRADREDERAEQLAAMRPRNAPPPPPDV